MGVPTLPSTFDDPHLVSRAGLVPVMALAQRAALAGWPRSPPTQPV